MSLLLEDFVIPICCMDESTRKIQRFFGTAFFISPDGIFLSAKHCIPRAVGDEDRHGLIITSEQKENLFSKITAYDYAPNNLDIVAGKIDRTTHNRFKFLAADLNMWQNVASLGYPENAIIRDEGFWIYMRAHQGYIHRVIEVGKLPLIKNGGKLIELSFQVTAGLSGAPLFIPGSSYDSLIGICIGNHASERLLDSTNEIEENGQIYKEISKRYEYAGIAQDIRDILDWKPSFLSKTIGEILK